MNNLGPEMMTFYDTEVIKLIHQNTGMSVFDALKNFWSSETYNM